MADTAEGTSSGSCRLVPTEVPWPCCQPAPATHSCCTGLLAGGMNPMGDTGDCPGSLIPSALYSLAIFLFSSNGICRGSSWSCCWAGMGTAEPCCHLCCAHLVPSRSRAGPGGDRMCWHLGAHSCPQSACAAGCPGRQVIGEMMRLFLRFGAAGDMWQFVPLSCKAGVCAQPGKRGRAQPAQQSRHGAGVSPVPGISRQQSHTRDSLRAAGGVGTPRSCH